MRDFCKDLSLCPRGHTFRRAMTSGSMSRALLKRPAFERRPNPRPLTFFSPIFALLFHPQRINDDVDQPRLVWEYLSVRVRPNQFAIDLARDARFLAGLARGSLRVT